MGMTGQDPGEKAVLLQVLLWGRGEGAIMEWVRQSSWDPGLKLTQTPIHAVPVY